MKSIVKNMAVTAGGVLIAGLVMFYLGKQPIIKDASRGFDGVRN